MTSKELFNLIVPITIYKVKHPLMYEHRNCVCGGVKRYGHGGGIISWMTAGFGFM